MVPKMCGMLPKICGMVPKMFGMVPKMCRAELKCIYKKIDLTLSEQFSFTSKLIAVTLICLINKTILTSDEKTRKTFHLNEIMWGEQFFLVLSKFEVVD